MQQQAHYSESINFLTNMIFIWYNRRQIELRKIHLDRQSVICTRHFRALARSDLGGKYVVDNLK